jgi:hypothetical protein
MLAYLTAATTGIRRQAEHVAARTTPPCRRELDAVHAHLAATYLLAAHLRDRTDGDDQQPAALHLKAAGARLWQATDHLHAAYHHTARLESCPDADEALDHTPPVTICQRHLTITAAIRLRTTPADLDDNPLHGHAFPATGPADTR